MRAGLEYDVGTASPTTGKSLTFGRRYGARFILGLGEVSGGALVLLHMGGHNLVPSADNVADGGAAAAGSERRRDAPLAFLQGIAGPERPPWRAAWACPMPNSPMARQASKSGGRSGHSRTLPHAEPLGPAATAGAAKFPSNGTLAVTQSVALWRQREEDVP